MLRAKAGRPGKMQDAEFIAQYEGLVRRVAERTRAQLSLTCELEDLVAFGFQGLLEARERFESERGVQFKTFAYYRIRGAIMDGVRSMAYLPRRAYARMRAAEALDNEAETASNAAGGQKPDAEASLRAIDSVLGQVAAAYSIAVAVDDTEQEPESSPEAALLKKERGRLTRLAIDALPEQERALVVGHYIEGQSLDQIGKRLGMSKSWASRLHSRALQRLRRSVQKT